MLCEDKCCYQPPWQHDRALLPCLGGFSECADSNTPSSAQQLPQDAVSLRTHPWGMQDVSDLAVLSQHLHQKDAICVALFSMICFVPVRKSIWSPGVAIPFVQKTCVLLWRLPSKTEGFEKEGELCAFFAAWGGFCWDLCAFAVLLQPWAWMPLKKLSFPLQRWKCSHLMFSFLFIYLFLFAPIPFYFLSLFCSFI